MPLRGGVTSFLLAHASLASAALVTPHASVRPGAVTQFSRPLIARPSRHTTIQCNVDLSIKVVGIGGGGSNTVNRMVQVLGPTPDSGVEFVCMNTDTQALTEALAPTTVQLGAESTRGLGAGGKPEVGQGAALESEADILACVGGQDMVLVTAGMGGGTGSGAAPEVARIARESGALTVGVVCKPFGFEGMKRRKQAEAAVERLREEVDVLIVIANDQLLKIAPPNLRLVDSFALADEVMRQGIVGLTDILVRTGLVNIDFADLRSVMTGAGLGLLGVGRASGRDRAVEAAMAAVSSPLLDIPLAGARRVVFGVTGGKSMSLNEVNTVATTINPFFDGDAMIIFGATIDEDLDDNELVVTVVATDFASEGI